MGALQAPALPLGYATIETRFRAVRVHYAESGGFLDRGLDEGCICLFLQL